MVRVKVDGIDMDLPADKTLMVGIRESGRHVPGMCLNPDLSPFGSCRLCLVDIKGRKVTACSTFPTEGSELSTMTPDIVRLRRTNLELMLSDHTGDCIGPCKRGCPANSDVQGYLALIANGRVHEAVKLMKERYILPAVLGRVCPAFCEDECRRGLLEGPVAIRQLKRQAADEDLKDPWMPTIPAPTGKKVAVVGGGPAGLSCAYYLTTKGHEVTIFEAMPELGGWARYGIPSYRLPKDILARDVRTVIDTGIEVMCNTRLGRDISISDLTRGYDSVFLGIGAWKGRKLGVPGEDVLGVIQGTDFLARVNNGEKVDVGKKVVVVGGGNTAMDVSRTCRRLGCDVTLTYRRGEEEMPAAKAEVEEAREEGVRFMLLCNPTRVFGENKLEGIELIAMELGEPGLDGRRKPVPKECSEFRLEADSLILAIGQYNSDEDMKAIGIASKKGAVSVDSITLQTSDPKVFSGGDSVLGPSTVIESIDQGRRAAIMMDLFMKGKLPMAKAVLHDKAGHAMDITTDPDMMALVHDLAAYDHVKHVTSSDLGHIEGIARHRSEVLEPVMRSGCFEEVEKTFKTSVASSEVKRCMSCGCMDAFECKLREYSMIYDAKQDKFKGAKKDVPLDDTHPHIVLDNNKCVLCGQCVNFTQEVSGEGVLDFNKRGIDTAVSPALGSKLGDLKMSFLGEMIDVCPTGAFTEKVPFAKPGPWETSQIIGVCSACGLGCEMGIETRDGGIVRAISAIGTWNQGHLCDIGRFGRAWAYSAKGLSEKGKGGKYKVLSLSKARKALQDHLEGMAMVLGGDLTCEEVALFSKIASEKGMPIGSTALHGLSTARLDDLMKARNVHLKADLSRYPVLRLLLDGIVAKGASLVEDEAKADIVIAEAPFTPGTIPAIVLHKGVNDAGSLMAGISGIPKADSYLLIGTQTEPLPGFTIALGRSDLADIVVPYPCFIERGGMVINSLGMTLVKRPFREGPVVEILQEMRLLPSGPRKGGRKRVPCAVST